MIRNFSEQFHMLINEDVPRKFLRSQDSRSGHLNEEDYGQMLNNYDEKFPVPEDGFIANYCMEKE